MKALIILIGLFIASTVSQSQTPQINPKDVIKPYDKNPRYWQYKGKPILLIGGTDNDNLFQNNNIKTHLDSLRKAGGNYIRNTMSDRDPGDTRAFLSGADGKYDLAKWNPIYWQKLKNLLTLAWERDIMVQIEIWDRFDHSTDFWQNDPYNPKNNNNYNYEQATFAKTYPLHAGSNTQPFFYTVPALQNNKLILSYQQAFVDKLLSIALHYPNVLYCIDNETKGDEKWAIYWADYVKNKAGNKEIYITQMWDDWNVKSAMHKRTIDHPGRYQFIDISQNSQTPGHANWENAQYVLNSIAQNPRPVNSTKIYGSNNPGSWLKQGKNADQAVHTFFRNLVGGFASSRFHRPLHGLGLSPRSINCMQSVRMIEKHLKFWDITPRMDLLTGNDKGEAYISAKVGEKYLIYFTTNGQVNLDLSNQKGTYTLRWLDVNRAEWLRKEKIKAGSAITLNAPVAKGCVALLTKK